MDILDVFYNQIVPEAMTGSVDCYFTFNILFNTAITGKINGFNEENLTPTLMINAKNTFDNLLIKYTNLALEFYRGAFADEITSNNLETKLVLTMLWANATYEDFHDPIKFLQKRIAFIEDQTLQNQTNSLEPKYVETLKSEVKIRVEKSPITSETPYRLLITLESKPDKYILPTIYLGIHESKAYIYAIQNGKNAEIVTPYQKKIKRSLYAIDEGIDIKNETFENYDIGNLKDVTSSFILTLDIALGLLKECGIKEIIVPSILLPRWNAKESANIKIGKLRNWSNEEIERKRLEHEKLQSNLTEKLLRTFIRLTHHHSGINVLSYPTEESFDLDITLAEEDECNNQILEETYNIFNKQKRK